MDKEKDIKVSDFSVFCPKSARGIFTDYPELRKFSAFSDLSNDEMLFVWFYACEASPFFRITDDLLRISKATEKSFLRAGKAKGFSSVNVQDLKNGKFPSKIIPAIEEMKKIKLGPRVRAMLMSEKMLDNLEKLLSEDIDTIEDETKKKAYVEMSAKALSIMPSLISQVEGRYGISEKEKKSDESGNSFIDDFHDNEK